MIRLSIAAVAVALAAMSPAPALAAPDPGRRLWVQCQACHSVKAGDPHKVGPNLHGSIGAKAASRAGFAYSPALQRSNLRWDDATLSRWLERPSALVPGNKMVYRGLASPTDRAALIAFLKRVTR